MRIFVRWWEVSREDPSGTHHPERYREQTQPDSDLCCHYFQDE